MLKKFKNQDGFTLLEAVISIAVLSVLSVFTLQMFITSGNANAKAQNIDVAAGKAQAVIEQFKALDDIDEVEELFAAQGIVLDGAAYSFAQGYDGNWMPTADEDAGFVLGAVISLKEEMAAGRIYTMTVGLVRRSAQVNVFADGNTEWDPVLVEYTVDRYFPGKDL